MFKGGGRFHQCIKLSLVSLFLGIIFTFTWSAIRGHDLPIKLPPPPHLSNLSTISQPQDFSVPPQTNWSRFAYSQYVTGDDALCNSVMIFESLHRLGSKPDRVMMHPKGWEVAAPGDNSSMIGRLLRQVNDEYNVKLVPIDIPRRAGADATWAAGYTKFLAFDLTPYDRVLHLDSDGLVLQSMDELFFTPPSPVAMPRAYWLASQPSYSAQVLLIRPSSFEHRRIVAAMNAKSNGAYDIEILNSLYKDNCIVLPHRGYNLLSGEFKKPPDEHKDYLGYNPEEEEWDANKVLSEVKYIHFSDWPMPKPWYVQPMYLQDSEAPACRETCTDREIWLDLYKEWRMRRKSVCDLDLEERAVRIAPSTSRI